MDKNSYIKMMLPYAQDAAARLGIPTSVILTQWAYETAWGTNQGSKYNNHGGIKFIAGPGGAPKYSTQGFRAPTSSGMYAGYNSLQQFTDDYVRVMSLSYYKDVRATAQAGGSIKEIFEALGRSPYAETGYKLDGLPGGNLLAVWQREGMDKYDTISQVPAPGPGNSGGPVIRVDNAPADMSLEAIGGMVALVGLSLAFGLVGKGLWDIIVNGKGDVKDV